MLQFKLDTLMRIILAHPDAAIDCGWTPIHWESMGFPTLARRRIQKVEDLKLVLANLGATEVLKSLRDYQNDEYVELLSNQPL